jgi:hypothetical protein
MPGNDSIKHLPLSYICDLVYSLPEEAPPSWDDQRLTCRNSEEFIGDKRSSVFRNIAISWSVGHLLTPLPVSNVWEQV